MEISEMLHKFPSGDLPVIIKAVAENPNLITVHTSALQALHGILPESPADFYVDQWPKPNFWFVIKLNRFIRPTVMLWESQLVSHQQVEAALKEFLPEMLDAISYHNEFWLITSAQISEELEKQMHAKGAYPHKSLDAPAYAFYMDDEAVKQLQMKQIASPPGFHFIDMDPEIDTNAVWSSSQYSNPGDEDMIRARLRALPSCAIAKDGNERPVAFELNDGFGFMHLQYTLPDYRRLGLGSCIELKLAQKNTELGIRPCKGVALSRPHVIAMSERSPYWSTMMYGDQPLTVSYKAFSKFEKPVQVVC